MTAPTDADLRAFAAKAGIRLDLAVLERVRRTFEVSAFEHWRPLSRSRGAVSIALKTVGGRYLLHGLTQDAISPLGLNVELSLMTFLREKGFCAPQIVTTRSGAQFLRHMGASYVLLLAESGKPYDAANLNHRQSAAQTLAGYHHLVRDFPGPYRLGAAPYLPDLLREDFNWTAGMKAFVSLVRKEELGSLEPVFASLTAELKELAPPLKQAYRELPRVMAHGAFDTNAMFFDADGRTAQVTSLANARYDIRLVDIADALVAFCSGGNGSLEQEACSQFLSTYERMAPLSEAEAAILPRLVRAQRLHGFVNDCRGLFDGANGGAEQAALAPTIQTNFKRLEAEPSLLGSYESAQLNRSRAP